MNQNIPFELRQTPQWCCYKFVWDEKKQKHNKPPISPFAGGFANIKDPSTYGTFEQALIGLDKYNLKGLSFVATGDDPFVFLDLDGCVDKDTGTIFTEAAAIIQQINSYTEISPSGQGIRIIAKGNLPPGGRHKGWIEVYDCDKVLTITGNHLQGTPLTIEQRQTEIEAFHKIYFPVEINESLPQVCQSYTTKSELSDTELLDKAMKNPKFARLWAGNHDGDHSAGDLALCNLLAFWCGCDVVRIDSLFRQSGLMRSKWDKRHGQDTYGNMTIRKAIKSCSAVYEPPKQKRMQQKTEQKVGETIQQTQKKRKFFKYTDLGNAERLIYQNNGNVRYCAELKTFFVWTGKHWRRDTDGHVTRLAIQTVRSMYEDAQYAANAAALCDWARQSESASKLESMVKIARSLPGVPVAISELDQQKYLLNCRNGTINLKTGELLKHRREDLITHCLPFDYKAYNAEIDCKQWVKFLVEITNNDIEVMNYLWRLAGLCLSGDTSEHVKGRTISS